MSTLRINQIRSVLEKDFVPKIDLTDVASDPQDKRVLQARSRALAAYFLSKKFGLSIEEACRCVTDGRDDRGIDALAVTGEQERTLVIVQSKWSETGNAGGLNTNTLLRLQEGLDFLVGYEWDRFNERISSRAPEIAGALEDPNLKVHIAIVSMTDNTLSEGLRDDFERYLSRVFNDDLASDDPEAPASFDVYNQGDLHDLLVMNYEHVPVNLTVELQDWGRINDPYEAFYGHVSGSDVAAWLNVNAHSLLRQNVRSDLKGTEVNKVIRSTAETAPEDFWYLNNGITVLCDSIRKAVRGGASTKSGTFDVTNARIVNGAQTSSTLQRVFSASGESAENCQKVRVMVRFISLKDTPDDFARRVTKATNTQNSMGAKDFASLDPLQQHLKRTLAIEDFQYLLRSGEEMPEGVTGCTFEQAAIALATVHSVELAAQAKRESGKLWEDINRNPYKQIFPGNLPERRLQRAYEFVSAVESQLEVLRPSLDSRTGAYSQHGNRFLEHVLSDVLRFDRAVDFERQDEWEEWIEEARNKTSEMLKLIKEIGDKDFSGYLGALFKNKNKTAELAKTVLETYQVTES